MSIDLRKKDEAWQMLPQPDGSYDLGAARLAVLMDIRDELKKLNRLMAGKIKVKKKKRRSC